MADPCQPLDAGELGSIRAGWVARERVTRQPDEKRPSFFKRWSKVHRERTEAHKRFMGEYHERSADLSRLGATADYKHVEAFYDANPDRRGDDVTAGTINDADLRWSISWLPKTGEVIALADNWLDADGPEHVPEYVFILGSAGSEQEARAAVARSVTLETLRDALYG
jgi:hypothetical protein